MEGTYSGKLLFTGGADGLLMVHDLRMKDPSRVLWHHNAGVHGLALEDPWLVSAASGALCCAGLCPWLLLSSVVVCYAAAVAQ